MEPNKSAALASSLTGIICDVRIRRSAGEHRTRLTSANRQRRRHWPPDAMARRCREFVDSRLRRSPPDRASAVPYGQAGENAMRFPRLAHRSAAAHKLHSTPQQDRMNLISGKNETSSRLPAFSLFLPGSCPNYRDRRTTGNRRSSVDKAKPFDIPKQEVWEAFKKVKANQGAAGVDGQSIADFEGNLSDNLYKLWNRMSSGSYLPPPVRRVDIPKGDGKTETRPLGIPTVADRIAQEVVKRYLEPILEAIFHVDSYGYRPGRSAIDAVRETPALLAVRLGARRRRSELLRQHRLGT